MNLKEFSTYDGIGLAELVKNKDVKSEELVSLALKGIEEVNPKINSVVNVFGEKGLNEIQAGLPKGDFEGVPFLIKEAVLHAKDIPASMGSRLAEGFTLPTDSFLMQRFRKAGFVTIGTTTTPEFAYNATTESLLYGPTHNPWGLGRSTGGSSGGAGASVASGIVPIAHGNDGGGSIRVPASNNGVIGLKPTRGRVTCGPYNSEPLNGSGMEFALTKTIRDTASLLDAVSAEQPGEYCYAPKAKMAYKDVIKQPVRKLRIAYSGKTASGYPVSQDVLNSLQKTVDLLRLLGHEVVEDAPVYDGNAFIQATNDIWISNIYKMIEGIAPATGRTPSDENLEAVIWKCYLEGKQMKASQLLGAIETSGAITRTVGEFFTGYDVFLTPTMSAEPVKFGFVDSNHPTTTPIEYTEKLVGQVAPFTALFNTTGQPAISLPLHMSKNGLPIGMQFAGRYGDEATLLQLGAQLEVALPWKDRTPIIHVGNGNK